MGHFVDLTSRTIRQTRRRGPAWWCHALRPLRRGHCQRRCLRELRRGRRHGSPVVVSLILRGRRGLCIFNSARNAEIESSFRNKGMNGEQTGSILINMVGRKMVRAEGVEPTQPCGQRIFLPLRLSPPSAAQERSAKVWGLDYPFTVPRTSEGRCRPSSLYTFPKRRFGLGSGLPLSRFPRL